MANISFQDVASYFNDDLFPSLGQYERKGILSTGIVSTNAIMTAATTSTHGTAEMMNPFPGGVNYVSKADNTPITGDQATNELINFVKTYMTKAASENGINIDLTNKNSVEIGLRQMIAVMRNEKQAYLEKLLMACAGAEHTRALADGATNAINANGEGAFIFDATKYAVNSGLDDSAAAWKLVDPNNNLTDKGQMLEFALGVLMQDMPASAMASGRPVATLVANPFVYNNIVAGAIKHEAHQMEDFAGEYETILNGRIRIEKSYTLPTGKLKGLGSGDAIVDDASVHTSLLIRDGAVGYAEYEPAMGRAGAEVNQLANNGTGQQDVVIRDICAMAVQGYTADVTATGFNNDYATDVTVADETNFTSVASDFRNKGFITLTSAG